MLKEIIPHLYVVVLVGGKGKRLRPLSTDRRPKAFISITRDMKTMFRSTLDRAESIVTPDRIIVVANRAHARLVRKDLTYVSGKNIILEPVSRNTAPAIGLAAKTLWERDKDAIMVVLPTDQYIPELQKQIAVFRKSIRFIQGHPGAIITIGLKPRYPSTQYGYIKIGTSGSLVKVQSFREKPDRVTAEKYVASGSYLWNTGTFIFTARGMLEALKIHAPSISRLLEKDNAVALYEQMPDVSIDYAVMEKAKKIYCSRASYAWSDVGSFDELKKVLIKESRDFVERAGKVVKIL